MAIRASIEQFGLERRNGGFAEDLASFNFLVPFSGPTTADEWQFQQIVNPLLPPTIQNLHKYAYSSHKSAYIVFEAFLQIGEEAHLGKGRRLTEMRLWEMLADSWTVSGNAPDSLRYVGFANIINATASDLVDDEWTYQEAQGQQDYGTNAQRILTITPVSASTWDQNPFIRCGVRLSASLSTASERTVTCVKAHLIRRHVFGIYMVLEFKNGQPGQENYREELMRKVEPMVAHNLEQKQAARADGKEWEEVIFLPPLSKPGSGSSSK